MAKLNWDRVRSERNISRYGSEYAKREREIYFRGNGASSTQSFQHNNDSVQKRKPLNSSPAKASTASKGYLFCPHCCVKVKENNLQKHVRNFHSSEINSNSKSNHSVQSNIPEEGTNLVEIKVGESKDGRVRLPASIFTGKSGRAIINGVSFTGNPGDEGRCKVRTSFFGAKPGQTIHLKREHGDVWKVIITGGSTKNKQTPNANSANGSTKTEQKPFIQNTRTTKEDSFDTAKTNNRIDFFEKKEVSTIHPAHLSSYLSPSPFSDKTLRDWFFDFFASDIEITETIATMGSNPFEEDDFDSFLYKNGIGAYTAGENTEILVIGRGKWDEEELEELLDKKAGKQLRVYSQEMFLAYLMCGSDPLRNKEVALKFAEGHLALEFLSNIGFDWINTFVGESHNGNFEKVLPKVGMLRHLGYRVGINGLFDMERQQILRNVFNSTLPMVVSDEYMKQWGKPKSKERLQKMANSIAAFCRNEKRKSNPSEIAISEWERDLDWLKKTYYTGRFSFQWVNVSF